MQAWAKESIWICISRDKINQIQRRQGDFKSSLANEEDEVAKPLSKYRIALFAKEKWINCFQNPLKEL